jgi:hypothetical protein
VIKGFNQEGQRTIGTISFDLDIDGFLTKVNFHVIYAPTTYNLLLGRPWLHRYKGVPSTVHQCLKYYKYGIQKRITADPQPFAITESYMADSRYYDQFAPGPSNTEQNASKDKGRQVTYFPLMSCLALK